MSAKLIIPDVDIARIAMKYWAEPTHYQAARMVTIALCESGGDAYALRMNDAGIFKGYLDRGSWQVNEGALHDVRGYWSDPAEFCDIDRNGRQAWDVWDWRYRHAPLGREPLTYAYNGWTTYRDRATDPYLIHAWPIAASRAWAAIKALTS